MPFSTLAVLIAFFTLLSPAMEQQPENASARAKVTNPHGPISVPCQNCHTFSSWKPIRSMPEFDHDKTAYPLRGMHVDVGCRQCHTSLVFKNIGTRCADCHADMHHGQFGASCDRCHTVKGWQVSVQSIREHQNRFPLLGAHALLDCDACHKGAATGQFQGLSTACYSCHARDFQTPVLDHKGNAFPTTCESCHSVNNWFGAKFDHLRLTGFALIGMHATLDCAACHINNQFKGTPANCYACHQKEFIASTNPPHVQAGFPHDCAVCHTAVNWNGATFDHNKFTKFALTGAHINVACTQCHVNGRFVGTPTDCASCHMSNFDKTNNPNHKTAGIPTTCEMCHTTVGWTPASFDHNKTAFPLTGAHTTVQCTLCHVNGNFTALPTDCASCHMSNFNTTTAPNHKTSGISTTCIVCHSTVAWIPASFDHSKTTFPLTGAHTTVQCALCHVNNNYTTIPTDCYGCHATNFNSTANPNHKAAGFPTTCATCHTTITWAGAVFSHSNTPFPLTGAHTTVACALCHINNVFAGTPTACSACHIKDFNGTTAPNHQTSGFPTDCSICHTTVAWSPSSFDHSKTPFPLTGAHTTVQCALCHVNNNFTTLPTDCYSCHTKDFSNTSNPNHKAAGFPTTCLTCHTTVSWAGASFNHNNTPFPLTGAHTTVACTSCHINNVFAGTPTDCYSCHKAQYTSTTNPNHFAAGFPTTCATCHTTTTWSGAVFNHTWFNTNHGGANGVCATCHTNSSNYAVFTCTNCHAKAQTDSNHDGVSGYVYNSVNCYACHKNGGGGG